MAATGTLEDLLRARRDLPPPEVRRALRRAAGVSLGDIAEELGVTAAAVAYWEAGLRYPRRENLEAYVRVLRLLGDGGHE